MVLVSYAKRLVGLQLLVLESLNPNVSVERFRDLSLIISAQTK